MTTTPGSGLFDSVGRSRSLLRTRFRRSYQYYLRRFFFERRFPGGIERRGNGSVPVIIRVGGGVVGFSSLIARTTRKIHHHRLLLGGEGSGLFDRMGGLQFLRTSRFLRYS